MSDREAHYLRALAVTRLPRAHAFLDTEARAAGRGRVLRQSWLCGALECWTTEKREGPRLRDAHAFQDRAELWDRLIAFAGAHKRVVVWAHNLGYDLRITGALRELPARGFRLQGIVLERSASWASFARPGLTLLFCDLRSWLPAPLASIGADVEIAKIAEGPAAGTIAEQLRRCARDVEITRAAVLRLLAFIDAEDLGTFRPTGAGQSMAAYRRRFLTERVLVHEDESALAAERVAMHAGRAEAWRHGRLADGPFIEFDLELAYCNIAASELLPGVLCGEVRRPDAARFAKLAASHRLLCEVEVTTEVECVPAPLSDRVLWPLGTFKTVLWDCEVALALGNGADVRFERIRLYRPKPVLQAFARWVLDRYQAERHGGDQAVARLLKHWSRTLVGRMALRYRSWDEWGEADRDDLSLGVLLDAAGGPPKEMMQVGRDLFELGALLEADSSLPQVTGWVTAECRARLFALICRAGFDNVVYVDTDSLIVTAAGARALRCEIKAGRAWSLREKGAFGRMTIRGPRNLDVESGARISGVPRKATRTGELEFEGEVWRSLRESVARGELDSVVTIGRTFRPGARDLRRRHLPGGATEPYRIEAAPCE